MMMNEMLTVQGADTPATDRRPWASHLISALLQRHPNARCLLLCGSVPDWAAAHGGPLTVVARETPKAVLQSPDLRFRKVSSVEGLVEALVAMAPRAGDAPYDLVFIDFHHELRSLLRQLRAIQPFVDARTLFLFDDAVPPAIAMTGPAPQPGQWWVGEVWMLAHLLRPANESGFVQTVSVQPTGLMAARGFSAVDAGAVEALYPQLAAVTSDAELEEQFHHRTAEAFATTLDDALTDGATRDATRIVASRPIEKAAHVEQIDLERAWAKPAPSLVVDLSGQQIDLSSIARPRSTHGTFLCDFEDVDLIGFRALLKDNGCFIRYEEGIAGYLERLAESYGGYANERTEIRRQGDGYVVARDLSQPTVVDAPVLFATPDEPDNWGMWLFQGLRSAAEFQREPDRYSRVLTAVRAPWQRDLLLSAGLDPAQLMEQDVQRHYRLRHVGIVTQTRRDLVLTAGDQEAFDVLADRMLSKATVTPHARIFISRLSRTQRGSYRGLLNEAELIDALAPLGFVAVEPETLPLADQIKLFRSAEMVVGLGGAAMFNTAFCKPPTRVVAIESNTVYLDAHTNIFASMGLDYGVAVGRPDPTDPRPEHRNWTIDVPAFVEALKGFL